MMIQHEMSVRVNVPLWIRIPLYICIPLNDDEIGPNELLYIEDGQANKPNEVIEAENDDDTTRDECMDTDTTVDIDTAVDTDNSVDIDTAFETGVDRSYMGVC